jgi:hypothetical protein
MTCTLPPTAVRLLLVVALAGALAGCGGSSDAEDHTPTPSAAQAFTSWVESRPASETDEPFAVDGIAHPTTETEEPVPLSG